jgi:hypothetical protein
MARADGQLHLFGRHSFPRSALEGNDVSLHGAGDGASVEWDAATRCDRRLDDGAPPSARRCGGLPAGGAFMEQSGRNRWQPVANAEAPKTAKTSQSGWYGCEPYGGFPGSTAGALSRGSELVEPQHEFLDLG